MDKNILDDYIDEGSKAIGFPYKEGQPAEIFHNGKWKRGVIVAGYRFRDGLVTIKTDLGERIWCGEACKELYRPVNEGGDGIGTTSDRSDCEGGGKGSH